MSAAPTRVLGFIEGLGGVCRGSCDRSTPLFPVSTLYSVKLLIEQLESGLTKKKLCSFGNSRLKGTVFFFWVNWRLNSFREFRKEHTCFP